MDEKQDSCRENVAQIGSVDQSHVQRSRLAVLGATAAGVH